MVKNRKNWKIVEIRRYSPFARPARIYRPAGIRPLKRRKPLNNHINMIIATMSCVYRWCFLFFSSCFFFFYARLKSACERYKTNTNFMTAIPDRFHPITIVGRPFPGKYRFSQMPYTYLFSNVQRRYIYNMICAMRGRRAVIYNIKRCLYYYYYSVSGWSVPRTRVIPK